MHNMIATYCYSGMIVRSIHDRSLIFILYKIPLAPKASGLGRQNQRRSLQIFKAKDSVKTKSHRNEHYAYF